jgi:hypothetical protein
MNKPFRLRMQKLRHVYTMLENLQKEEIAPDASLHLIITDIKKVVDDLQGRTAP